MHIQTASSAWRKLFAANQTTSFTSGGLAGQAGKPSGSGVVDVRGGVAVGAEIPNALMILPFGAGADTNTIKVRIWGWEQVLGDNAPSGGWWTPVLLAEILATLSTPTGTAGGPIVATDLLPDTIAVTYGNEDVDITLMTNGANVGGCWALIDLQGFSVWQAEIDKDAATNGNLLFRYKS